MKKELFTTVCLWVLACGGTVHDSGCGHKLCACDPNQVIWSSTGEGETEWPRVIACLREACSSEARVQSEMSESQETRKWLVGNPCSPCEPGDETCGPGKPR